MELSLLRTQWQQSMWTVMLGIRESCDCALQRESPHYGRSAEGDPEGL